MIAEQLRHILLLAGYKMSGSVSANATEYYAAFSFVRGYEKLSHKISMVIPSARLRVETAEEQILLVEKDPELLPFDKVFILGDVHYLSRDPRIEFITREMLLKSALQNRRLHHDLRDPNFLGGRFTRREVVSRDSASPQCLDAAVISAVLRGARLVVLSGSLGSGKSTALSSLFRAANFVEQIAGQDHSFVIEAFVVEGETSNDFEEAEKLRGRAVVHLADMDDCWLGEGTAVALRKLKHFIAMSSRTFDSPVFVIDLSAHHEDVASMLVAACSEILDASAIEIFRILPFNAAAIKAIVQKELGHKRGGIWWDIISSSQEISQIAEWPSGLSSLLESVFENSWDDPRPSQSNVIGALVDTFITKAASHGLSTSNSETRTFMMEVAREMNAAQELQISILKVHQIFVDFRLRGTFAKQLSARDCIVPGVLILDSKSNALRFERPIFLHYFLAAAVHRAVNDLDMSRQSPLYCRRLPVALLSDAVELGMDVGKLWEFIRSTRYRTSEENGYIGGNAASLLRLAVGSFRGADLSECNLKGAIFAGCDLTEANFSRSSLIDVGLANATLDRADFRGANFEAADLKSGCTIYRALSHAGTVYLATSSRGLVRYALHRQPNGGFLPVRGFRDSVFALAVSRGSDLLVAGGQDGTIHGWELKELEPRFILRGHSGDVRALEILNSKIVSGSVDGRLNIWEPTTRTLLTSIRIGEGGIWSFVPVNSEVIAVLCDHGQLHLVNLKTGNKDSVHCLPRNYTKRVSVGATGEIIVGGDGFLWSLKKTDTSGVVHSIADTTVRVVVPISADKYLIGGGYGHIIQTDSSFRPEQKISVGARDYISDICPLDEDQWLVSDASGRVAVIAQNGDHWQTLKQLEISSPIGMSAVGADFTGALNIPNERRARLIKLGAKF